MPCAIKLQIHQARGLTCDRDDEGMYVEVSFNDRVQISSRSHGPAYRPVWNDHMGIEIAEDFELQECPLRLGVCSSDTGPPDHGGLSIDLEQTLYSHQQIEQGDVVSMQGWFPLFDTMSGICGHILLTVKLQFVGDQSYNDRSTSSVGVRFFSIGAPPSPSTFAIKQLFGLVQELKVVMDPEYHWRDFIRSDRSSNEERLRVFHTAAMQARRQLGKKVLGMGADAVLGYREYVDLEGDATDRICIRAFGTAALLESATVGVDEDYQPWASSPSGQHAEQMEARSHSGLSMGRAATPRSPAVGAAMPLPASMLKPKLIRNISDSSAPGMDESAHPMAWPSSTKDSPNAQRGFILRRGALHSLDRLPAHIPIALGGVVVARAVKIINSRTTQDNRETWWAELRDELLSHARALGCDCIVGYHEHISIADDLALLSVMGTALVQPQEGGSRDTARGCELVHAAEGRYDAARLSRCPMCREGLVPNILLATVDFPEGLPITGRTELVEARVCRLKRKLSGEANAQDLSEALPFMELELHKQLVHKMRVMGLNAAFGLRVEISHGPSLLVGVATATAALVPALPRPPAVHVQPGRFSELGARQGPWAAGGHNRSSPPSVVHGRSQSPGHRPRRFLQCPARCGAPRMRRLAARLVGSSLAPPSAGAGSSAGSASARRACKERRGAQGHAAFERLTEAVAWHRYRRAPLNPGGLEVADSFDFARDDLPMISAGSLPQERDIIAEIAAAFGSIASVEDPFLGDATTLDRQMLSMTSPMRRPDNNLMRERHSKATMQERRTNAAREVDEEARPVFIFEVDDEADEDLLAVIDDPMLPDDMALCTVECIPGGAQAFKSRGDRDPQCSVVYGVRRVDLFEDLGLDPAQCTAGAAASRAASQLTSRLAEVLNEMYACVLFRQFVHHGSATAAASSSCTGVAAPLRCCLASLRWRIAVLEDDVIELVLTGQMLAAAETAPPSDLSSYSLAMPSPAMPNFEMPPLQIPLPSLPVKSKTLAKAPASHVRPSGSSADTGNALPITSVELVRKSLYLSQARLGDELSMKPIVRRFQSAGAALRIDASPPQTQISPDARAAAAEVIAAAIASAEGASSKASAPVGGWMAKDDLPPSVLVSALSAVPHCIIDRYCGLVTVHMIKETVNVTRHFESLQVFYHQFVAEALLTAKAHVLAVGGNALLGYRINNLFLREDKRRAYAVISISGDAACLAPHVSRVS